MSGDTNPKVEEHLHKTILKCHFTEMEYCWSDSDDLGGIEEWLECKHCGHTEDIPYEKIRDFRR